MKAASRMGLLDWLWGKAMGTEPARFAPSSEPEDAAAAPPPASAPPARVPPRYGIENVIALLQALPLEDDPDLVLRVVRKTLRSTGVSVEEIVESARKRESGLAEDVARDRASIGALEREIAALRANIDAAATRLVDTRTTRQRLQEAIESESKVGLMISPEERARLLAGGAATADREGEAAAAPGATRSSMPPAPRTGAPPPLRRSVAPKPPPALPSRSIKAGAFALPKAEPEATSIPEPPARNSEALTPVAQLAAQPFVLPIESEISAPAPEVETPAAPSASEDAPADGADDSKDAKTPS